MAESFKVYITFPNNQVEVEEHTEDSLPAAIMRLIQGPAAQLGMIKEVKVVDTLDCIVFLAKDGNIIFPTREQVRQTLAG